MPENESRDEERKKQELIYKLQIFDQQIQQLQQQLQAVEQAVVDLHELMLGLDELKSSKGKEIMAPFGKGIFVKAKLISEDLTVDVGGKNLVKKSIPDTKAILEEQIKNLEDIKKNLSDNMENMNHELMKVFGKIQGE
jgi:prefoldin alpha subunit